MVSSLRGAPMFVGGDELWQVSTYPFFETLQIYEQLLQNISDYGKTLAI